MPLDLFTQEENREENKTQEERNETSRLGQHMAGLGRPATRNDLNY